MKFIVEEDRQRSALAKDFVHRLAAATGWEIQPCPNVLPPILTHYSYADRANTILAHFEKP